MNREPTTEFESRMSRGESLAALLYLPVHILALPLLLTWIMLRGWVGEAGANLLCYALGFMYMLAFEGRFLRREFDPLCDRPGRCLLEICVSYGLMLGLNLCVNGLLTLLLPAENPNNAAIMDMAGMEMGKISAMAVFLAPVVEELMFRGGVFGRPPPEKPCPGLRRQYAALFRVSCLGLCHGGAAVLALYHPVSPHILAALPLLRENGHHLDQHLPAHAGKRYLSQGPFHASGADVKMEEYKIKPVAHMKSDFPTKFGIPRQAGIVPGAGEPDRF